MHICIDTVEKSRTARSDKNTNSCPKTYNKTVTGYIFYHTTNMLQTSKLEESIFSTMFLKTFNDAKFTLDGSALQTLIRPTLSTKNFCLTFLGFYRVYIGLE